MSEIVRLSGCTAAPFGAYLKALGVLRLVSKQADCEARGWWDQDTFLIESALGEDELTQFFLERYVPTPIVAPWNGGSGFYPKDNQEGLIAISESSDVRFASYREVIDRCRALADVRRGKIEKDPRAEDERRTAILLECRNTLPDDVVEWLDAAVGIAADGSRAFAPVLGTGGNEGRLDYTNNFTSRLAGLLIASDKKIPIRQLLRNSLFGEYTSALQLAAAGQYDPGRAGGANQGEGITTDSATNPWDLVIAMEGAVSWASGLYRRQGVSYRSILCSPFTVYATKIGYGSASRQEDARAEIWAPLWNGKATYAEIRILLREGRASVAGREAETGLQFAEAATGLGVDRSIDRFVRYSLLKRRGDSYVALPTGIFPTEHRSESDRIRELEPVLSRIDRGGWPKGAESLRRRIDSAMYEVLLRGGANRLRQVIATFGRLTATIATTTDTELPYSHLDGKTWVYACGAEDCVEVRIAAALASLNDREAGPFRNNLTRTSGEFAWRGRDLPNRLLSVLERRQQQYSYSEASRPFDAAVTTQSGDATLFLEGSTDDSLIEALIFGFAYFRWDDPLQFAENDVKPPPAYAALKYLCLPKKVLIGEEYKRIRFDPRIIPTLRRGNVDQAVDLALHRMRVSGLKVTEGRYFGGMDPIRLGASLLIPAYGFGPVIRHEQSMSSQTV